MERKQAGNLIRAQGQQMEHDARAAVQNLIRNDYQEYGILDCLEKWGIDTRRVMDVHEQDDRSGRRHD